jgi:predicted RNA-binding protein
MNHSSQSIINWNDSQGRSVEGIARFEGGRRKISFNQSGRTGNNIFQYMASKLLSILYGHEYVVLDEFHGIECIKINSGGSAEANFPENSYGRSPENSFSSAFRSDEKMKNEFFGIECRKIQINECDFDIIMKINRFCRGSAESKNDFFDESHREQPDIQPIWDSSSFVTFIQNIPNLDTNRTNDIEYLSEMVSKYLTSNHIVLSGYFQKSEYFIPYRHQLIRTILNETNPDYWVSNDNRIYVNTLLGSSKHSIDNLKSDDIVINLRLDDFIQMPNPRSDILPPQFYLDILTTLLHKNTKQYTGKIYIVCDRIRYDWEHRYLRFFDKFNPILIQNTIEHDIALMRDAPVLIHSNSTLCWVSSFFSRLEEKRRYIPKTFHYSSQSLNEIDNERDLLFLVKTLEHNEVFNINIEHDNHMPIYPLSYCIPDECILSEKEHDDILQNDKKTKLISGIIPNGEHKYNFNHLQEKEYNEEYRKSYFAYTNKKGGWDCLRHYEIMANGCIPVFKELELCPKYILTTFPKELIIETNKFFDFLLQFNRSKNTGEFIEDYSTIREHLMNKDESDNWEQFMSSMPKYINSFGGGSVEAKNEFFGMKCRKIVNFPANSFGCSPSLRPDDKMKQYSKIVLNYIREHCSSTSAAKYFMNSLLNYNKTYLERHYLYFPSSQPPSSLLFLKKKYITELEKYRNILLIRCNVGVNYTRELLWIGLKNYFSSIQENFKDSPERSDGKTKVIVEYPKIDYLYKSFPEESKKNIYGNGFTYSRKIDDVSGGDMSEDEIIEKTKNNFWDLIIFGKVGPDEGWEGTIPQLPLWEVVSTKYTREQIVFLYGGDECINLKYNNRYNSHIQLHSQYGHCFVRELDM